ncbi:helical backbone metal receptor [Thiolapillus sp.]
MNNLLQRCLLLTALALCNPAISEISVRDDLDREITLATPAERIITLAPHATEMLLAIDSGHKIIAAAHFFDYPPSMRDVPKINTLGGLDREALLGYQPDLVIAWASGNRPGDLQWLADSAIPVFMSEPKDLAAIAATLEKLGALSGEAEKGKYAANRFSTRIADACQQRRNSPMESAYYEIWPNPPMTIGGKHWLNEVLQLARLRNIFSFVPRAVFTVSMESLLAHPPQVILTTRPAPAHQQGNARVILASPTLGRPGPRIAEGLEQLCQAL